MRTSAGLKGKMDPSMETIEENPAHSGGTSLLVLKAEILSALSSVGTATTTEELRQADIAYKKALYTARSKGYRPHIRATEGQEIQVEWVALGPRERVIHSIVYLQSAGQDRRVCESAHT